MLLGATHGGAPPVAVVEVTDGRGSSGPWHGGRRALETAGVEAIAAALAAAAAGNDKAVVVINADAKASHQSVVDVMQAAQQAGLSNISFATQTTRR